MILEAAILNIKKGLSEDFEKKFQVAKNIISSIKGYISHELKKYIVKDHEIGFRTSEEYKQWKELLHHFYEPFPTVEHYT